MTHIEQELRKSRTFRQAAGKHAVLSITYVRRRLWWYLVTRVIAFMAGCVFLLESLISVKAFFEINTQIGTLSSVSVPVEAQLNQIIYHPTTSELSPLLLGIAFLLVSLVSFVCVLITHYRIHQFLENVGIQGQLMELRSHEDGMSDSDKQ